MQHGGTNLLYIAVLFILISSCRGSYYGVCNQKFTRKEGKFKSPNFPFWRYPTSMECKYTIKGLKQHYIEITFHTFRLEPSYKGERTDYLEIFDGRKKNRQQEVYYDGTIPTPFKFTSKTARVIIRFFSNAELNFKGFMATFKNIPLPSLCDVRALGVEHGSTECVSQGGKGMAVSCDVTCDAGYARVGNKTTYCVNGKFSKPPACVVSKCEPKGCLQGDLQVEHGDVKCEEDEKESIHCDVTCDQHYKLLGDATVTCENGLFLCPPSCLADPHTMESCTQNPKYCPYDFEEVTNFFLAHSAAIEEAPEEAIEIVVAEMTEQVSPLVRASGICHKRLCEFDSKTNKRKFLCNMFVSESPRIRRFAEMKRTDKMTDCLNCQMINCGLPLDRDLLVL